ncbi:hypothetical protein [Pseudooceanicola sp.]|uniref:hypothetical protein n=1 Tax=Pseudooceanicola sp. TaxID=1914328 RepID=UPI00405810C0
MVVADAIDIPVWLSTILQSGIAASIALAVLIVFRDSIGKYFAAEIEFKTSAELEKLKAKLKAVESRQATEQQELVDQRTFFRQELVTARRERNAAFQQKKVEVAEELAASFEHLNRMNICIEMLKTIRFEEWIAEEGMDDAARLFALLAETAAVDVWLQEHKKNGGGRFKRQVFLPQDVVKYVETYEMIVTYAVSVMKLVANSVDPKGAFRSRSLREQVLNVLPEAQGGFEKFGDSWVLHCADLSRDRAIEALRSSLWGTESDAAMRRDVEYALRASSASDALSAYSTLSDLGFPREHLRGSVTGSDAD